MIDIILVLIFSLFGIDIWYNSLKKADNFIKKAICLAMLGLLVGFVVGVLITFLI